jgi:hypothetical protein
MRSARISVMVFWEFSLDSRAREEDVPSLLLSRALAMDWKVAERHSLAKGWVWKIV